MAVTILEQHHIAFPILKIINSSGRSAVSWRGGLWRSPPWAKKTPHWKMLDIFWTTARIMICSLLTETVVDIADLWVRGCNPQLPNCRKSFINLDVEDNSSMEYSVKLVCNIYMPICIAVPCRMGCRGYILQLPYGCWIAGKCLNVVQLKFLVKDDVIHH